MKSIKKILAVMVALVMTLGLTATNVFADDDASITITDKDPAGTTSQEFVYYELLKASIDGDAVSYYIPSPAGDTLKEYLDAVTVGGVDLFTFTKSADGSRWNVTINEKDSTTHAQFTDADGPAIAEALNTANIKGAALVTNANDDPNTFKMSNGSASATGLNEGYYLITSSLGTALVLETLGQETIETKNEYHTNVKTASKTNMTVGETVTYTITVHIPATYKVDEEVTVHDTLDSHLAADLSSISATCDGNPVALSDGTKKAATETFAKKFTITAGMLNKDVVITYNAELLSSAADDTGYVNEVFSNTSSYETVPNKVRVWTFGFELDKNFADVTGDAAANYSATFELTKGNKTYRFTKSGNAYKVADSDDTGADATITVNGKDIITISGLEAGTYTLTEKTTAAGYNLLTEAITVTITDTSDDGTATDETKTPSHEVSYTIGNDTTSGVVTIVNQSGSVLPSTGGIGTTIFYAIGSVLVVGAGVLLISKKRMFN